MVTKCVTAVAREGRSYTSISNHNYAVSEIQVRGDVKELVIK
jgi:hypothetical protein